MKIAIGADHAAYDLKESIKKHLKSDGHEIIDFGCNSTESVDYPDFAHPLSEAIENNTADFGVLMCGSGQGMSMAANKHKRIRSALCWIEDIAKLAREHNNANVLVLPARFINEEKAKSIVDEFLQTEFEGGRHERRVNKISI